MSRVVTHDSVAANVRRNKEKHPENFCPVKRCLWRTGGGLCPKHRQASLDVVRVRVTNADGLSSVLNVEIVGAPDREAAQWAAVAEVCERQPGMKVEVAS